MITLIIADCVKKMLTKCNNKKTKQKKKKTNVSKTHASRDMLVHAATCSTRFEVLATKKKTQNEKKSSKEALYCELTAIMQKYIATFALSCYSTRFV